MRRIVCLCFWAPPQETQAAAKDPSAPPFALGPISFAATDKTDNSGRT
jgi:hypothetical protein